MEEKRLQSKETKSDKFKIKIFEDCATAAALGILIVKEK